MCARCTVIAALLGPGSAACTNDFDGLGFGAASTGAGGAGSGVSSSSSSGAQGGAAASAGTGADGGAGATGGAPAVGGSGGTRACSIREVEDDFKDGMIDAALWFTQGATVQETGGKLEITPPPDTENADIRLTSVDAFDLHGCTIDVEVVETLPSATMGPTTFKAVGDGEQTWLRIGVVGDLIAFGRKLGGDNDYYMEIAYDPAAHRRWRISEEGGTVYFSTSPNPMDWTVQFQAPTPPFVSAIRIQLSAGTYQPIPDPGTATFDNLNR